MDKNERLTRLRESRKHIAERSKRAKQIPQGFSLEDLIEEIKQDRVEEFLALENEQ